MKKEERSLKELLKVFKVKEKYDFVLLITVLLLSCFGLLMVYSTSSVYALEIYGDPSRFLKLHTVYLLLGICSMLFFMNLDYRILKRFVYPAYLICLILLILVLIPGIGKQVSGAQRWLAIGPITFQPSEIAKFAIVLYLAYSLDKKKEKIQSFSVGFLSHLVMAGIFILLVFLEPDFGTSATIFTLLLFMMFISKVRMEYLFLMFLMILTFSSVAVLTKEYRIDRIISFIDPWKDPLGSGYQTIQSFIAFGVGGIHGMGLGDSTQKLFFLPQAHTDFIFSIVGEELGFIGVVMVIMAFIVILFRSLKIAIKAPDLFGCYLVYGFVLLLTIQAAVNMGVSVGLFPTKGLTLPFMSYGGSSLVSCLSAVGIILSVSRAEVK